MIVDDARIAVLREQAVAARPSRTSIPLEADDVVALLESHAAARELADAVAAFQTIDGADGPSTGSASAAEIRNRFRRRVEERTLRVNTALAKFRAVTEGRR